LSDENLLALDSSLRCSECGSEIGQLIRVRQRVWLRLGVSDVAYVHGVCGVCRKLFHFDSRDYRLHELIYRIRCARIGATE
jgi:DNA-directed RNA polymerase subunit RPC12/RpoP